MLYRIVAAFLLIPASFVIYDNVLTKLMTLGARRFFSYTARKAPALILKKNFLDNPKKAYKIMLALLTKDKETVGEALEELYGIV